MSLTRINDRARRISRNPASKPTYQRRILEALAHGMSPARAANAAGVGRSTAYLWRQEDPEFAAKWDEAVAEGIDRLEDEVYRRAVEGVKRPVYRGGVLVGEITKYSDKLLMFLLQRRRPEVYARSHGASGNVDTKVLSVEEARSRFEKLGLPVALFEGDYEELDAPREPSRSSVSASVSERGQAIVGNVTQAARGTAPEKAAKSLPALTDTQQTPMTVGEPERAHPFRRGRKDDGRSSV
jgi:hypothetical protein